MSWSIFFSQSQNLHQLRQPVECNPKENSKYPTPVPRSNFSSVQKSPGGCDANGIFGDATMLNLAMKLNCRFHASADQGCAERSLLDESERVL